MSWRGLGDYQYHNHSNATSFQFRLTFFSSRYNPLLDRWERRKPTHKPRFGGSLHPIHGKIYLVGGVSTKTHETFKGMKGEEEVVLILTFANLMKQTF